MHTFLHTHDTPGKLHNIRRGVYYREEGIKNSKGSKYTIYAIVYTVCCQCQLCQFAIKLFELTMYFKFDLSNFSRSPNKNEVSSNDDEENTEKLLISI